MKRVTVGILAMATVVSISSAEKKQSISTAALENLVYQSAMIQGKWPAVDANTPSDTTSTVALDCTLNIIAIAQEISRQRGEKILEQIEHKPCLYAEIGYKYARYSACPLPAKIKLLESIQQINMDGCGKLLTHVKGQAALELLKYHHALSPDRIYASAERLAACLRKLDADGVAVARYWRMLSEIQELTVHDPSFARIIQKHFDKKLTRDLSDAQDWLYANNNPNYFGVQLYSDEMYATIPKPVIKYWCTTWRCGEDGNKGFFHFPLFKWLLWSCLTAA